MSIKSQATKLKNYLEQNAEACIHEPDGHLTHRFVTPTCFIKPGADDHEGLPERSRIGHYLQMYDWDACFFTIGVKDLFPGLIEDVIHNFVALKNTSGYIPRTVSPRRLWDYKDVCKPFLCQTLLDGKIDAIDDDMLTSLQHYLDYFDRHRKKGLALYGWRNVLESGVDNNLALLAPKEAAKDENHGVGDFPVQEYFAVDLSCYLCLEYRAFATILKSNGRVDLAQQYQKISDTISEMIELVFWDQETSMYYNCHSESASRKIKVRAWTGLLPVLLGLCSDERAEQVIKSNLLSESQFFRPAGITSLAISEPLFNNARRGLYGRVVVSNWQGPVWVLPNVLAVRCLIRNGYLKQAQELSVRVVRTLASAIESRGSLFENYDSEHGEPLWADHFIGWNALARELIEFIN